MTLIEQYILSSGQTKCFLVLEQFFLQSQSITGRCDPDYIGLPYSPNNMKQHLKRIKLSQQNRVIGLRGSPCW